MYSVPSAAPPARRRAMRALAPLLALLLIVGGLLPASPMAPSVAAVDATDLTFTFTTHLITDGDTRDVALGDLNGDGALDLVLANSGTASQGDASQVYLNDGTGRFPEPQDLPASGRDTSSVALGDLNGDGALDLVLGNRTTASQVYLNDGRGNFREPQNLYASVRPNTWSVALGDLNGDEALDLVLANSGTASQVYLNDRTGHFPEPQNLLASDLDTTEVALGDLNGDGALDLVLGNYDTKSQVYLNDRTGSFGVPRNLGSSVGATWSIALGDLDGDGALDLVLGNAYQPSQVYLNTTAHAARLPNNPPAVTITRPDPTPNANFYSTPVITDSRFIPITYTLTDPERDPVREISATFSLDGGGRWKPAVALTDTQVLSLSTSLPEHYLSSNTRPITITDGGVTTSSLFVGGTETITDLDVSLTIAHTNDAELRVELVAPDQITVKLFEGVGGAGADFTGTILDDDADIPITMGSAPFSGRFRPTESLALLNGKGSYGLWKLRVTDTAPGNGKTGALISWGIRLRTDRSRAGKHIFTWDTFKSGFFGQSDNVVFRIVAYPGVRPIRNGVPGPYQRPYASATTFPFRVRGTQVRVLKEHGEAALGALVYRLAENARIAERFPPPRPGASPLRTGANGYLGGRGELGPREQLVAMLPISATSTYTMYITSARPITTGLAMTPVAPPGEQKLTVSRANALILFNLDVSLEWDARSDAQFMSQLTFYLRRASELLYDWTDGQAALGEITVYHDRHRWYDKVDGGNLVKGADIRIYATNRMRPSASQGGIRTDMYTETLTLPDTGIVTNTYEPGHVEIGATWSHYGDIGTLGEDWAPALAHELGHYALYLDDNYLGLDNARHLMFVSGCRSAMSDPYRDDYSELHPREEWAEECANTLSNRNTGRSDWETVKKFYTLNPPEDFNDLSGPSTLPLAVTQVRFKPETPMAALPATVFSLVDAKTNGRYVAGAGAQAFLFQGNQLIDLGQPALDQVTVRGARSGDRLCVYDLLAEHLGCKTVAPGDSQLKILSRTGWQPNILVTPVTSRTVAITVTDVPTDVLSLSARLFPADGNASPEPIPLGKVNGFATSSLTYTGNFTLATPVLGGYVQVWEGSPNVASDAVHAPDPREIVTAYNLGGDPAPPRRPPRRLRRRTAAVSADGQVILFADNLRFERGEFFAIQTVSRPPDALPWTVPVGSGYRLLASAKAPSLKNVSINVGYSEDDVAPGTEGGIGLYFWDGATWTRIITATHDPANNEVSGQARGPGLYALMTGLNVHPGWNLVSYPWQSTLPVTKSLELINGARDNTRDYTTVYGRVITNTTDRWKVYDVDVPTDWAPLVNDLKHLEYGQGYWINVIEGNASQAAARPAAADAAPLTLPPATYYGIAPDDAKTVEARVKGTSCGKAATKPGTIGGQTRNVFVIDVRAAGPGDVGCGLEGQQVIFTFSDGAQTVGTLGTTWDNNRVHELRISRIYLPLIMLFPPTVDLAPLSVEVFPTAPAAGQPVEVRVAITNEGSSDISMPFWVDLYVDPRQTPAVNLTWPKLSDFGASWRVYGLKAGETRVLSTKAPNDPLDPGKNYSNFQWFVSGGPHRLSVLVDSYAPGQDRGAVVEYAEGNNLREITVQVQGAPQALGVPPRVDQRPAR